MKTKLTKIDVDWKHVKNACRTTVNKKESNMPATPKFKEDLLISEHSPIRRINISWLWGEIKSWIATHGSRHKNECYISTQRSDRTGINRDELSQSEIVMMDNDANAQQLIDICRKRLCYCSSKETREYYEDLKITLNKEQKTYELSNVLVPNCVYRCGCCEPFQKCSVFENFKKKCEIMGIDITNIKKRYEVYNKEFHNTKDV